MVYWEKQRGGLCRLHSINAFYGKPELDENKFKEYCKEYDTDYSYKGIKCNCLEFDQIPSSQETIISWILEKHSGIKTLYIPYNKIDYYLKKYDLNIEILVGDSDFFFIFNESHIWGIIKTQDGSWHKVDSIQGVSPYNLNFLRNTDKIGLVIPRTGHAIKQDLNRIQLSVFKYLYKFELDTLSLLEKLANENKILDDLETDIFLFFRFLRNTKILNKVIWQNWQKFEKEFNKNPGNFENIKEYVPIFLDYVRSFSF